MRPSGGVDFCRALGRFGEDGSGARRGSAAKRSGGLALAANGGSGDAGRSGKGEKGKEKKRGARSLPLRARARAGREGEGARCSAPWRQARRRRGRGDQRRTPVGRNGAGGSRWGEERERKERERAGGPGSGTCGPSGLARPSGKRWPGRRLGRGGPRRRELGRGGGPGKEEERGSGREGLGQRRPKEEREREVGWERGTTHGRGR